MGHYNAGSCQVSVEGLPTSQNDCSNELCNVERAVEKLSDDHSNLQSAVNRLLESVKAECSKLQESIVRHSETTADIFSEQKKMRPLIVGLAKHMLGLTRTTKEVAQRVKTLYDPNALYWTIEDWNNFKGKPRNSEESFFF